MVHLNSSLAVPELPFHSSCARGLSRRARPFLSRRSRSLISRRAFALAETCAASPDNGRSHHASIKSFVGIVTRGLTERTISQNRFLSHFARIGARLSIVFAHSARSLRYWATPSLHRACSASIRL